MSTIHCIKGSHYILLSWVSDVHIVGGSHINVSTPGRACKLDVKSNKSPGIWELYCSLVNLSTDFCACGSIYSHLA